jgi:hypothetical protein
MTKIRNENLGLAHSRLSSTINRVYRRTGIGTFARRDLLILRNFTIAICFVFLAVSAQAQTADVDKNWTTVGSAGTLDETSVGKVFFEHGIVQRGRVGGTTNPDPSLVSTADSAVIRYNVTAVDSFFVPRVCRTNTSLSSLDVRMRLRYLASGPGARVVAKLIEVDLAIGTEKVLLTFDSAGPGLSLSDNYQVQSISVCGRPWNFDFQNKAYYIEATLTGSSIAAITAAGIQMIEIDNFTRPAVVDQSQCARIAREIERLEKLPQSKAISLRILGLEAESARLGCS